MSRLTTNKPTSEMNMTELAHNGCYAEERLARYRDFDHQLETMAEETIEDGETHVEVFHKSNVFLTKAEAEAKLEEMEGK